MKKSKQLSKERISEMAYEVMNFLIENEIQNDTRIYFNNKMIEFDDKTNSIKITEDISPKTYFKYAADNHILSMSFEGGLYDIINYEDLFYLTPIFKKYGCYDELGNMWNLSVCPDMMPESEIEFTVYQ